MKSMIRQMRWTWSLLLFCIPLHAQQAPAIAPAAARPQKTAYYIDTTILNAALLLPPPPAVDSPETKAELLELHRMEQSRTPAQVAQANADAAEENIFAFNTVFGPHFNAQELPITAALGDHVKNEQSVVGGEAQASLPTPSPLSDRSLSSPCLSGEGCT
jgi:acid phosphatase (class A)